MRLMDRDFNVASQELQQNLNSLGSRQKSGNNSLETLQWSFSYLHSLTDFERTVERDYLVAVRPEELERRRFNCRHMVPKTHESRDAVCMNHPPVQFPVNKFCEQVARKHRFNKPDGPAAGQLPKPNARRNNRHLELTAESGGRYMFSFRRSFEAKPKRSPCFGQLPDSHRRLPFVNCTRIHTPFGTGVAKFVRKCIRVRIPSGVGTGL